MLRNLRRIDIGRSWQLARQQFAALVSERDHLRWELAQTRKSLNETRDALIELRAAVLARQKAELELAALYRERAIARARAAERDPASLLN
jgi:hypothetical protein